MFTRFVQHLGQNRKVVSLFNSSNFDRNRGGDVEEEVGLLSGPERRRNDVVRAGCQLNRKNNETGSGKEVSSISKGKIINSKT